MTGKKGSIIISDKGKFIMTGGEDLSQYMGAMAKLKYMLKIYYDKFRETCHNIFKSLIFSFPLFSFSFSSHYFSKSILSFSNNHVTFLFRIAVIASLATPFAAPFAAPLAAPFRPLRQCRNASPKNNIVWRTGLTSSPTSTSATTTPPSRCHPTATTGVTSAALCRSRFSQCTV